MKIINFFSLFFVFFSCVLTFSTSLFSQDTLSFSGKVSSFSSQVDHRVLFGIASKSQPLSPGDHVFDVQELIYAEYHQLFNFPNNESFHVDLGLGGIGVQRVTPNQDFDPRLFLPGKFYYFFFRISPAMEANFDLNQVQRVTADYVQEILSVPYAYVARYAESSPPLRSEDFEDDVFASSKVTLLNRFSLDQHFEFDHVDSPSFRVNDSQGAYLFDIAGTLNVQGRIFNNGQDVSKPYFVSQNYAVSTDYQVALFSTPMSNAVLPYLTDPLFIQGRISGDDFFIQGMSLLDYLYQGWEVTSNIGRSYLTTDQSFVGILNPAPVETLDVRGALYLSRAFNDFSDLNTHPGVIRYGESLQLGKTFHVSREEGGGIVTANLASFQGQGESNRIAVVSSNDPMITLSSINEVFVDNGRFHYGLTSSAFFTINQESFSDDILIFESAPNQKIIIDANASMQILTQNFQHLLAASSLNASSYYIKGVPIKRFLNSFRDFVYVNGEDGVDNISFMPMAAVPPERLYLGINDPLMRLSGALSDYAYSPSQVPLGTHIFLGSISNQNAVFAQPSIRFESQGVSYNWLADDKRSYVEGGRFSDLNTDSDRYSFKLHNGQPKDNPLFLLREGNLGVGTNQPLADLHVYLTGNANVMFAFHRPTADFQLTLNVLGSTPLFSFSPADSSSTLLDVPFSLRIGFFEQNSMVGFPRNSIMMGYNPSVTAVDSLVLGGYENQIFDAGYGSNSEGSVFYSTILGGYKNKINAPHSLVMGAQGRVLQRTPAFIWNALGPEFANQQGLDNQFLLGTSFFSLNTTRNYSSSPSDYALMTLANPVIEPDELFYDEVVFSDVNLETRQNFSRVLWQYFVSQNVIEADGSFSKDVFSKIDETDLMGFIASAAVGSIVPSSLFPLQFQTFVNADETFDFSDFSSLTPAQVRTSLEKLVYRRYFDFEDQSVFSYRYPDLLTLGDFGSLAETVTQNWGGFFVSQNVLVREKGMPASSRSAALKLQQNEKDIAWLISTPNASNDDLFPLYLRKGFPFIQTIASNLDERFRLYFSVVSQNENLFSSALIDNNVLEETVYDLLKDYVLQVSTLTFNYDFSDLGKQFWVRSSGGAFPGFQSLALSQNFNRIGIHTDDDVPVSMLTIGSGLNFANENNRALRFSNDQFFYEFKNEGVFSLFNGSRRIFSVSPSVQLNPFIVSDVMPSYDVSDYVFTVSGAASFLDHAFLVTDSLIAVADPQRLERQQLSANELWFVTFNPNYERQQFTSGGAGWFYNDVVNHLYIDDHVFVNGDENSHRPALLSDLDVSGSMFVNGELDVGSILRLDFITVNQRLNFISNSQSQSYLRVSPNSGILIFGFAGIEFAFNNLRVETPKKHSYIGVGSPFYQFESGSISSPIFKTNSLGQPMISFFSEINYRQSGGNSDDSLFSSLNPFVLNSVPFNDANFSSELFTSSSMQLDFDQNNSFSDTQINVLTKKDNLAAFSLDMNAGDVGNQLSLLSINHVFEAKALNFNSTVNVTLIDLGFVFGSAFSPFDTFGTILEAEDPLNDSVSQDIVGFDLDLREVDFDISLQTGALPQFQPKVAAAQFNGRLLLANGLQTVPSLNTQFSYLSDEPSRSMLLVSGSVYVEGQGENFIKNIVTNKLTIDNPESLSDETFEIPIIQEQSELGNINVAIFSNDQTHNLNVGSASFIVDADVSQTISVNAVDVVDSFSINSLPQDGFSLVYENLQNFKFLIEDDNHVFFQKRLQNEAPVGRVLVKSVFLEDQNPLTGNNVLMRVSQLTQAPFVYSLDQSIIKGIEIDYKDQYLYQDHGQLIALSVSAVSQNQRLNPRRMAAFFDGGPVIISSNSLDLSHALRVEGKVSLNVEPHVLTPTPYVYDLNVMKVSDLFNISGSQVLNVQHLDMRSLSVTSNAFSVDKGAIRFDSNSSQFEFPNLALAVSQDFKVSGNFQLNQLPLNTLSGNDIQFFYFTAAPGAQSTTLNLVVGEEGKIGSFSRPLPLFEVSGNIVVSTDRILPFMVNDLERAYSSHMRANSLSLNGQAILTLDDLTASRNIESYRAFDVFKTEQLSLGFEEDAQVAFSDSGNGTYSLVVTGDVLFNSGSLRANLNGDEYILNSFAGSTFDFNSVTAEVTASRVSALTAKYLPVLTQSQDLSFFEHNDELYYQNDEGQSFQMTSSNALASGMVYVSEESNRFELRIDNGFFAEDLLLKTLTFQNSLQNQSILTQHSAVDSAMFDLRNQVLSLRDPSFIAVDENTYRVFFIEPSLKDALANHGNATQNIYGLYVSMNPQLTSQNFSSPVYNSLDAVQGTFVANDTLIAAQLMGHVAIVSENSGQDIFPLRGQSAALVGAYLPSKNPHFLLRSSSTVGDILKIEQGNFNFSVSDNAVFFGRSPVHSMPHAIVFHSTQSPFLNLRSSESGDSLFLVSGNGLLSSLIWDLRPTFNTYFRDLTVSENFQLISMNAESIVLQNSADGDLLHDAGVKGFINSPFEYNQLYGVAASDVSLSPVGFMDLNVSGNSGYAGTSRNVYGLKVDMSSLFLPRFSFQKIKAAAYFYVDQNTLDQDPFDKLTSSVLIWPSNNPTGYRKVLSPNAFLNVVQEQGYQSGISLTMLPAISLLTEELANNIINDFTQLPVLENDDQSVLDRVNQIKEQYWQVTEGIKFKEGMYLIDRNDALNGRNLSGSNRGIVPESVAQEAEAEKFKFDTFSIAFVTPSQHLAFKSYEININNDDGNYVDHVSRNHFTVSDPQKYFMSLSKEGFVEFGVPRSGKTFHQLMVLKTELELISQNISNVTSNRETGFISMNNMIALNNNGDEMLSNYSVQRNPAETLLSLTNTNWTSYHTAFNTILAKFQNFKINADQYIASVDTFQGNISMDGLNTFNNVDFSGISDFTTEFTNLNALFNAGTSVPETATLNAVKLELDGINKALIEVRTIIDKFQGSDLQIKSHGFYGDLAFTQPASKLFLSKSDSSGFSMMGSDDAGLFYIHLDPIKKDQALFKIDEQTFFAFSVTQSLGINPQNNFRFQAGKFEDYPTFNSQNFQDIGMYLRHDMTSPNYVMRVRKKGDSNKISGLMALNFKEARSLAKTLSDPTEFSSQFSSYIDFVIHNNQDDIADLAGQVALSFTDVVSVAFMSIGRDYAEYLLKRDVSQQIKPASVVGLFEGKVSLETQGADKIMVASSYPIIAGNMPLDIDQEFYQLVAFLGQVPVKVRGKVEVGQWLLPSGLEDGCAIAVDPSLMYSDRVFAKAWSSFTNEGEGQVNALIGFPFDRMLFYQAFNDLQQDFDDLKNEYESLQQLYEQLTDEKTSMLD